MINQKGRDTGKKVTIVLSSFMVGSQRCFPSCIFLYFLCFPQVSRYSYINFKKIKVMLVHSGKIQMFKSTKEVKM